MPAAPASYTPAAKYMMVAARIGRVRRIVFCSAVATLCFAAMIACGSDGSDPGFASARRTHHIALNGTWQIAEGDGGDVAPAQFDHTVAVPGFVDEAQPPFAEVGVPSPHRAAFWYRRQFDVPADVGPVAVLRLHKAKYGVAVWLNGVPVGSHLGAFTLAEMDVSSAVIRGARNTITVRVGADRLQLPPEIPSGEDLEKLLWLPGLWDDVTLAFSGEQRIVRVKIEPHIDSDEAVVLTTIANHSGRPLDIEIEQRARASVSGAYASSPERLRARIGIGETTLSQVVSLPGARWWSPEDPFLYTMRTEVRAGSEPTDELETRFGMRSVEWRSGAAPGFFLNGERYYLRGSNLSLHRFFQDPERGSLPWDRDWVRRLLTEHPRRLHWNSMRVSIGRLPNMWYDLADEIGLLLADEFMMWSLARDSRRWSIEEMEREYRAWMQENWNHPSIAWWDASNETDDPKSTMVIERVRGLDPTRQWENGGHSPPQGANDPIEEHPYILFALRSLDQLSTFPLRLPVAPPTVVAPGHPYILNEYNLLWLQSNGQPFPTSAAPFEIVPRMNRGPYTAAEYREASAYVGAILTEFWRTSRLYAGVQHFTYITSSPVTSDNFLDVRSLIMEPRWARYAADAFSPVALYLDYWDESPGAGTIAVPLRLINDFAETILVDVELLAVDLDGNVRANAELVDIELAALGDRDETLSITVPAMDRWVLFGRVEPHDGGLPVAWSRRKIGFEHLGEPIPDPPFDERS